MVGSSRRSFVRSSLCNRDLVDTVFLKTGHVQ